MLAKSFPNPPLPEVSDHGPADLARHRQAQSRDVQAVATTVDDQDAIGLVSLALIDTLEIGLQPDTVEAGKTLIDHGELAFHQGSASGG